LALWLALAMVLTSCGGPPAPGIPPQAPSRLSGPEVDTSSLVASEAPATRTLHVLHVNDFHGQIYPRKGVWLDEAHPPDVGGANAVAGYVAKIRAEAGPENVILLDSGDIYSGTPEGDMTGGLYIVEYMNALQFDAMALGNHEFDRGPDVLVGIGKEAQFPILSANVLPKSGEVAKSVYGVLKPVAVVERAGLKIGLVGVTAEDTPAMTHKFAGEALEFGDARVAIGDAVGTLKADGADFVLVLSHLGKEVDEPMLDSLPNEVLAVLGGHSHTGIDPPLKSASGKVYMQTWGKGSGIDHMVIEVGADGPRVVEARLVPLMAADWQPSPLLAPIEAKYNAKIAGIMDEPLGECKEGLRRGDKIVSSVMGNFITDVFREVGKAELGVTNKSGVRADIPPGPVTMRSVHSVAPFGNTIVVVELTGAQLLKELEFAGSKGVANLELSGGEVTYDMDKAVGSRVKSAKVGGKALDPKKVYKVATNSFLAEGGDGHGAFAEGKATDTGIVDKEALASWFRAHKVCAPVKAGRILANHP